jgi:lysophospholipase L1-like esterase
VDFGAGAEALYANEVPGLAVAAGGATNTAIDAHLGGDATGLVTTVAGKLDSTVASSTFARSGLVNIVFDGDSITFGTGATGGLNYVADASNGLDGRATIYDTGIGAQTMASMLSVATDVDSELKTGPLNICSAWGGTNDLYFGATAADTYASIVAYHQARKAAGWDKTIAYTITPRSDGGTPVGFEAARQALNALIVAGWATFADALVDIGNDAVMGAAGANTDATLYMDGVHPTNKGHALIAGLVRKSFGLLGVVGSHTHYLETATVFIPPDDMHLYGGTPALSVNGITPGWTFAAAAVQNVAFGAVVPFDWNTFTVELLWANNGAGAGAVLWGVFWDSVTVGTALTQSGWSAVAPLVTAGAQNVPVLSAGNGPVGAPASKMLGFMIQRWGGGPGDTLANGAILLGVYLRKAS